MNNEEIIQVDDSNFIIRTTEPEKVVPEQVIDVPFNLDEAQAQLVEVQRKIDVVTGILEKHQKEYDEVKAKIDKVTKSAKVDTIEVIDSEGIK